MEKLRLADLSPAYFGMVMATGIVSVAAHMQGLATIAHTLFWLNVATYAPAWRCGSSFTGAVVSIARGL